MATRLKLRIATRQSELALWQAEHVAGRLAGLAQVTDVTLVPLSTRGDEVLDDRRIVPGPVARPSSGCDRARSSGAGTRTTVRTARRTPSRVASNHPWIDVTSTPRGLVGIRQIA